MLSLVACGNGPREFTNRTRLSQNFFYVQWQAAQTVVATAAIRLNPGQIIPIVSTPDKKAFRIQPDGLVVEELPDVTAAQMLEMAGIRAFDPTGELLCPAGCDVQFTPAYSTLGTGVYYARSLDAHELLLSRDLQYEFENQILFRLGYNVSHR